MKRITALKLGAITIPVVHNQDSDDHGEYQGRADREGGVRIETGPAAGEPGVASYAITILHEAIHAISDHYGLDLKEKTVRVLEQQLSAMFQDNPEFSSLYWNTVVQQKAQPKKRS